MLRKHLLTLLALTLFHGATLAADLKPYVLAYQNNNDLAAEQTVVVGKLEAAGFTMLGDYSPAEDKKVLIVSNDTLQKHAALSNNGGFGAAIRVSLVSTNEQTQVAYVNPVYMANVYQMKTDLQPISDLLAKTLGAEQSFGSEKGLSVKKLRKYHYMAAMPYFKNTVELAKFDSYEAAIDKVESAFAAQTEVEKVYRVDVSGKKEALFGVSFTSGKSSDSNISSILDSEALSAAAHFPYDFIVTSTGEVLMLNGKFRIAQSYPDLTMGTFMKISSAPNNIRDALRDIFK